MTRTQFKNKVNQLQKEATRIAKALQPLAEDFAAFSKKAQKLNEIGDNDDGLYVHFSSAYCEDDMKTDNWNIGLLLSLESFDSPDKLKYIVDKLNRFSKEKFDEKCS